MAWTCSSKYLPSMKSVSWGSSWPSANLWRLRRDLLTSASITEKNKKIWTITTYSGDRVDWTRGPQRQAADELVSGQRFFVVVWVPVLQKSSILYLSPIEEQIRLRSWPISIQSVGKKPIVLVESGTLWLDRSQPLKQSHLPREPEEHGEWHVHHACFGNLDISVNQRHPDITKKKNQLATVYLPIKCWACSRSYIMPWHEERGNKKIFFRQMLSVRKVRVTEDNIRVLTSSADSRKYFSRPGHWHYFMRRSDRVLRIFGHAIADLPGRATVVCWAQAAILRYTWLACSSVLICWLMASSEVVEKFCLARDMVVTSKEEWGVFFGNLIKGNSNFWRSTGAFMESGIRTPPHAFTHTHHATDVSTINILCATNEVKGGRDKRGEKVEEIVCL